MSGRLDGKVAIVTGGNQGIGQATVHRFAEEGARVAILARREDEGRAVEAAVRDQGGDATFIPCDVTDRQQIAAAAAVAATVDAYGGLDILFNNAGGAFPGEFPRESDVVWHQTIDVNLTGTFRMTKACWNHLSTAAAGSIINMSSFSAHGGISAAFRDMVVGLPPAAYASAKGGVESFTRYVAGAGAPHGVRANCVAPGEISTPATEPGGQRLFQEYFETIQLTEGLGQPIDVANVVTFLASDEARFVNAQIIAIDGGASGKV